MKQHYNMKSQLITLTRGQLKELKKQISDECMKELLKRNEDILNATGEDCLYIILLTGMAALIDEFQFDENCLFRFANAVANVQDDINDGIVTLESLEEKVAAHGCTLRKDAKCAEQQMNKF